LREFQPLETGRRIGTGTNRRKDFQVALMPNCDVMRGLGPLRGYDKAATVDRLLADPRPAYSTELFWDKRVGRFYLIVKHKVARPADTKPLDQQKVLAVDPGVWVFGAFVQPDGTHGELLHGAKPRMKALCDKAAKLQSKLDLLKNIPKADGWDPNRLKIRSANGRLKRARAKLRNWMTNMHYESIKQVFSLADLVVLPVFNTQRMTNRATRVFQNETARAMYTWSHYKYSQRMWSKAQVTADKNMVFSREPGTTRTCDACGHFQVVGAAKVFRCQSCRYEADRDVHGARGNLLAALGAALNTGWDGVAR
jgi:transposase